MEVILVEHGELQYGRISGSYALRPEEQQWLREQELSNALAEAVNKKFRLLSLMKLASGMTEEQV